MRRALGGLTLLLVAVATGACQVVLTAGVQAERDGSGWVRAGIGLDGEALRELGDPARELRLEDLRQSGWDVIGPERDDDGLTWVRVAKRFATPEDASRVAAELSGQEGPFRDFRLERSRSFFKTRTSFSGLIDLSRGLAGLNDPALQEKLGDHDLGLERVREGVKVRVEAELPGRTQSWEPALGEQVRMEVASEAWNLLPLVPAAAGVLFAVAALAVSVAARR
ncbi:MAG: hypothetical protein M3314_10805 [Actinomycetota bacterium]|nr:hypothetical protein [Actinomycetota bacterium]